MELGVDRVFSKGKGFCWSSVFAGTFVSLAIEVTFAMLAWAIFGPARGASLNASSGIWMIILTIIALYFGAKTTAHFSGETRRLNGMYYGLVTFGLAIFASILIATMAVGSTASNSARILLDGVAADAAWLFVSLILGGIAAAIGGALGTMKTAVSTTTEERATLHPAA